SSTTAVRGAYGIFYHGRNPNGWSGVPWGQTMGFQQFNEVQAPNLPYEAAFNWGNGYPGVVRDRDRNPSLAANPYNSWGPVSWDPDAGRVGNTQQWNFNIQQQLPGNIVFDIGYVGSKSTGVQANELRRLHQMHPKYLALGDLLTRNVTSQAAAPALHPDARYPAGFSGDMPLWQALSPFPHLATWNTINSAFVPLGFGTYHSMQLQLNKRYSHGIWLQSNYTWSKTIDNLNSAFGDTWGMNGGRPMDYYNLSLDKSVSASDRTHVAKLGAAVDLPFGRGRRFGSDSGRVTNFVAGGWTVQFIGNYSSGEPLGFGGTGVPVGNFSGQRGLIVNPEGKPLKLNWDSTSFDMASITTPGTTAHRYLDTSLVVDPASVSRYQLGNAAYRYSQLRAPAYFSDDLSLQKNFRPIESMRIQFRVEALNAFNRHRFNQIETNTASPLFGQVTGVSDDRRQFQFGVRADW
ncbi:MAG TPA: hypothetical protein VEQ63_13455, partial [Bryobacteraceae bacterium]|nr:hypothetical protein [Bryobacteraceae bacterium]